MIINKPGEKFNYNDTDYIIGATIIGTEDSEYSGLFGRILEIRVWENEETENGDPDLYCCFDPPVLPHKIKEIEETFSRFNKSPKTIEDICFDYVVMAPEMIRPISVESELRPDLKVYIVVEDKVDNDNPDIYMSVAYTDKEKALYEMSQILKTENECGYIAKWKDCDGFVENSTDDFYEIFLDGHYTSHHYCIFIMGLGVDTSSCFLEE